jgi:hypothetical protein
MSEDEQKRGPGRPPGLPKTGGRKKGTGNKLPAELRHFINERGRPLDFLAAIASGRKVTAADPSDPGKKLSVYPTLSERAKAAETLLGKILPDLKSTELSGPEGEPLIPAGANCNSQLPPDVETARRVAFLLASGLNAQNENETQPESKKLEQH